MEEHHQLGPAFSPCLPDWKVEEPTSDLPFTNVTLVRVVQRRNDLKTQSFSDLNCLSEKEATLRCQERHRAPSALVFYSTSIYRMPTALLRAHGYSPGYTHRNPCPRGAASGGDSGKESINNKISKGIHEGE